MDFADQIKRVYDKLEDDCSREIYSNRILYNLTNDKKYLFKMVSYYYTLRKMGDFLIERQSEMERPVIFGAGAWGRMICDVFPSIKWMGFIDNNKKGSFLNLKIMTLDEYMDLKTNGLVIVSPRFQYEEIERQLMDSGIDADRIFSLGRCELERDPEYFENFLPHSENEVFIDAGVYDGGTTLDFITWCGGNYKKVYMFEPSLSYYERFYNNVSSKRNVTWIKKGLWSNTATIKFFDRPDHDISIDQKLSGIDDKYTYSDGEWMEIPVTSIDEELRHETVTFIKLDIEGAELEALKGAKEVICRDHPKLAICLYHKKEDIWTLPSIILDYNPEYKLYVRHYSYDMLDTVLYAI